MKLYKKWIVKNIDYLDVLDWDEVICDGHGWILTTDGTRIDLICSAKDDIYKIEREKYNNQKIN